MMFRQMTSKTVRRAYVASIAAVVFSAAAPAVAELTFTQIIDVTGDGRRNPLEDPRALAVDDAGNVFVAGFASRNVFRVEPGGRVVMLIDSEGDEDGRTLSDPKDLAVSDNGDLFVLGRERVFRISNNGFIRSQFGTDVSFHSLGGIGADGNGNVYVGHSVLSFNTVTRISETGGLSDVMDELGAGPGGRLAFPVGVATDEAGNVYVCGRNSYNVLRFDAQSGIVTEIIDILGGGVNFLQRPTRLAIDSGGHVYVLAESTGRGGSGNAFRIDSETSEITEIINADDGLSDPSDIAVGPLGNVYVSDRSSATIFRIAPDGSIDTLTGLPLVSAGALTTDAQGVLFVADPLGNQVLRIVPEDCNRNGLPDQFELDSDGDGTIDDCDACEADPDKTDPGTCGCGAEDSDNDGNGISDCLDPDPASTDPAATGSPASSPTGSSPDTPDPAAPADPETPADPAALADPAEPVSSAGLCGIGSANAIGMFAPIVMLGRRARRRRNLMR